MAIEDRKELARTLEGGEEAIEVGEGEEEDENKTKENRSQELEVPEVKVIGVSGRKEKGKIQEKDKGKTPK